MYETPGKVAPVIGANRGVGAGRSARLDGDAAKVYAGARDPSRRSPRNSAGRRAVS